MCLKQKSYPPEVCRIGACKEKADAKPGLATYLGIRVLVKIMTVLLDVWTEIEENANASKQLM